MLVPLMALLYVLGCVYILQANASYVVPALRLIVRSAFSPEAAGGGFAGGSVIMAARYGIARGLFSNESGLGSAPIVAAAARTKNPVRQALVSSTGTFWDTVVICALTGLVIVSSIMAYPDIDYQNGAELTKVAFAKIPVVGPFILSFGLLTFAFSTILGWSYYGERAMEYLGHPHILTQTVRHGRRIGHTIGIPTVNLTMPPRVLVPAHGVYITRVYLPDGRSFAGVTNVGTRPTVSDSDAVSVETFLLDFDGDLYGQSIRLDFCRRLRGEQKFDSLEALRQGIQQNIAQTRAYFRGEA